MGGQGVLFRELIQSADDASLLQLVPGHARKILEALRPEALVGDSLRQLVISSAAAQEYLAEEKSRKVVFSMLGLNDARLLAGRLSLPLDSDPHTALTAASATLTAGQQTAILEFFGANSTQAKSPVRTAATEAQAARYPLFAHQRDALHRVKQLLYSGSRRVVLHMPTGSGKTRTAMNVVAEHLRSNEPTLVIWLASTQELLEQAASEFEVAWSGLGNRELSLVRMWGNKSVDLESTRDGLIVAGLGKLYATTHRDVNIIPSLGDAVSLVVVDEAHQSIADTYQQVVSILATKRPSTSLLGLTATPGRTYNDVYADAELSRFWSGNKVMLSVPGFDNPVEYLIAEGYLAKPRFRTVTPLRQIGERESSADEIETQFDVSHELLEQLGANQEWNLIVLKATIELLQTHRRVIVFATSVAQAVLLSALMRALGYETARTVTGQTPQRDRDSILSLYTSNTEAPMALFNYGVLTTGFDAPATSAAVIARPTRSLVLYSQMVGRALRGPLAGGNREAEIVTVVDPSLPGFGNPSEAFANWEDVW
jgi:superfamily II DNA or RNA helicase